MSAISWFLFTFRLHISVFVLSFPMHDFILIRPYHSQDKYQCDELVKSYIMECSREAFMTVLFKEITLQLTVLICALLFIFFGMPPLMCLAAIPVVLLFIFLSVYGAYFNKSVDLCNDRPQMCWVAELHYRGIEPPKNVSDVYSGISKENLQNMEANKCRKTIIGTAAIKLHQSCDNSAWLYRVAFSSAEYFKNAGDPMLQNVLKYCVKQEFYNLETVARECDDEYKELLIRSGFLMKQIYNKKILGSALQIMKAQMRVDVTKWSSIGNA